jgi:hypothetical protein
MPPFGAPFNIVEAICNLLPKAPRPCLPHPRASIARRLSSFFIPSFIHSLTHLFRIILDYPSSTFAILVSPLPYDTIIYTLLFWTIANIISAFIMFYLVVKVQPQTMHMKLPFLSSLFLFFPFFFLGFFILFYP